MVAAAATATSLPSISTGNSADNEEDHLQKSLDILTKIFNEQSTRDGFELVTTEGARKRWM